MKKEHIPWIHEDLIPTSVKKISVQLGFEVPVEMTQPLGSETTYCRKDVDDIRSAMYRSFHNCEEKVVMGVFEQYLGRVPELEDAKRGTRISHISFPNRYILCIDDNQLGMIIRDHQNLSVSFIPGLTVFNK